MAAKKVTKEDFVCKAEEKFGKLYGYSNEYEDFQKPMKMVCPIHDVFEQSPRNHLRSKGCPKCNVKEKKNFEMFQKEVSAKYGNTITVKEENYIGFQDYVTANCDKHGDFKIMAYNLLRNNGCQKCSIESTNEFNTKSHEDFVKEAKEVHGDFYLYPNKYNGANTKIDIECPIHKTFSQSPSNHIRGNGCPKCGVLKQSDKVKLTLENFISRANIKHNGFYNYDNVHKFANTNEKVNIMCPLHGIFPQHVGAHIRGYNCPKCAIKNSKPELDLCELIESCGLTVVHNDYTIIKPQQLDIVIPELKIAIEYNGLIYHREGLVKTTSYGGGKYRNYHLNKTKIANLAGYKLIHIFEDEWLLKKDIVKSKILHLLGKSEGIKIGARSCTIQKINSKTSKEFLNKYHIQGEDNAAIRYGSFYIDELVGVMTFLKSKDDSHNLNRFATNSKFICVGLASKHLAHFIREHKPSKIITFADRRFTLDSENNLYVQLGFKLVETQKPTYHYYNVETKQLKRINRQHLMKHKILKNHPNLDATKTEQQLAVELGYDKIWDCGNFKYELCVI